MRSQVFGDLAGGSEAIFEVDESYDLSAERSILTPAFDGDTFDQGPVNCSVINDERRRLAE